MQWIYNDGGRVAAGYKGHTRDCTTRAIAIATQQSYQTVYDTVNGLGQKERPRKGSSRKSGARTGIGIKSIRKYLSSIGWIWTPTMLIGSGCKVHMRESELPCGRIIVRVAGHLTCVIDGIVNDTWDCTRNGTACVYGYWSKS